tara:strand:- start:362 stop:982 length:621 start_codon:yes stop_codon:yes gene_type:complete
MAWDHTTFLIQVALNHLGATPLLRTDGIDGPRTQSAKALQFQELNRSAASRFKNFKHFTSNKGGAIHPIGVVFHHTAGSFVGSLEWCKDPEAKVSYHVIIEKDGSRHQLVPFNRRAWANGKSSFNGRTGCNGFMISIAFSESTYDRELTTLEIESAKELIEQLKKSINLKFENITDHRTISPGRKNDLNPIEFKRLQNALEPIFKL